MILLMVTDIVLIIVCVRLIVMAVREREGKDVRQLSLLLLALIAAFSFLFSPKMGLGFCLSYLNKSFDVWGYSHI